MSHPVYTLFIDCVSHSDTRTAFFFNQRFWKQLSGSRQDSYFSPDNYEQLLSLFLLNKTLYIKVVFDLCQFSGFTDHDTLTPATRLLGGIKLLQRDSLSHGLPGTVYCVVWNADGQLKTVYLSSSLRAQETFLQWDQFRRFYNFLMADNMKKIILSHR